MRIALVFILFTSFLFAHKLNIFLYEENNKIVADTYFASGSPCKNCKIEIFDENDKLIKMAKTNDYGKYIFNKLSSKLTVKVEALGGHGATSFIQVEKLESQKQEVSQINSYLESFIAVILIALIFLGLKRIKK